MALLITKDVSILGEISINEIYTRLNLNYDYSGNYISVNFQNYVSKNSFGSQSDMENYKIQINGMLNAREYVFPYVNSDGDILLAAHNKLKDFLSTDILEEVIARDPSTGEVIYIEDPYWDPGTGEQMTDPSTGELLWWSRDPSTTMAVVIPKFCPAEDIEIVDVSLG